MTRNEARRRHHNIIVCAKRLRQSKHATIKREAGRLELAAFQECLRDPETGLPPYRIVAPRDFCLLLAEPRTEVLIFLENIRKKVCEDRCIYIDFSQTTRMVADGTLLFYAEMDRLIRATSPKKHIRCSYPTDKVVEQVLQQVGFFRVIGKRQKATIDHDMVKHWNSATGTKVEGKKIEPLQEYYQGSMATPLLQSVLFAGITEAMTNCCNHAYPKPRREVVTGVEEERRWWMFSQEKGGELSIVFCDLGIGIPASLTKGESWEPSFIKSILARLGIGETDASLIQTAFEIGKSTTGEEHRGKGLQEIRDVLAREGQGSLKTLSGNGCYEYEAHDGRQGARNFAYRMPGTLIFWKIPIRNEQDNGRNN